MRQTVAYSSLKLYTSHPSWWRWKIGRGRPAVSVLLSVWRRESVRTIDEPLRKGVKLFDSSVSVRADDIKKPIVAVRSIESDSFEILSAISLFSSRKQSMIGNRQYRLKIQGESLRRRGFLGWGIFRETSKLAVVNFKVKMMMSWKNAGRYNKKLKRLKLYCGAREELQHNPATLDSKTDWYDRCLDKYDLWDTYVTNTRYVRMRCLNEMSLQSAIALAESSIDWSVYLANFIAHAVLTVSWTEITRGRDRYFNIGISGRLSSWDYHRDCHRWHFWDSFICENWEEREIGTLKND